MWNEINKRWVIGPSIPKIPPEVSKQRWSKIACQLKCAGELKCEIPGRSIRLETEAVTLRFLVQSYPSVAFSCGRCFCWLSGEMSPQSCGDFSFSPTHQILLLLPMSLACFVPIVSKSLQSSAQCARKEETVPEDRPSCLTATPRSHGCYLFVTHFSSHRAIGQCSLVTWVSRTAGTLKKLPGQSRRKADGLRLGARAKKKETRPAEASRGWLGGCLWTLELESPNVEKKRGDLCRKWSAWVAPRMQTSGNPLLPT